MRNLSNGIAGAAGLVILLGALAATPNTAYGQNTKTQDVNVTTTEASPLPVRLSGSHTGRAPSDVPVYCAAVPDLGDCQNLQVPAGNKVSSHVYAEGVQIYRWDGTSWIFLAPEAVLYANAGFDGEVGTHYAGPTWESNSGSKVVGRVLERCTADSNAIPWLLLEAVYTQGPGIFDRVTYIQRVNTVGGKAPTDPGGAPGDEARVPYTAEYFFYREHH